MIGFGPPWFVDLLGAAVVAIDPLKLNKHPAALQRPVVSG
jgi:hypothetical protein